MRLFFPQLGFGVIAFDAIIIGFSGTVFDPAF
jgi:hypothetical protein